MDFGIPATTTATWLGPLLPRLVKGSEELAAEIGEKIGDQSFSAAKKHWSFLSPSIEAQPAVQGQSFCPNRKDANRKDGTERVEWGFNFHRFLPPDEQPATQPIATGWYRRVWSYKRARRDED